MIEHKIRHHLVLKTRWWWIFVLVLGMSIAAFGHVVSLVVGVLSGLYLLYVLADANGYVAYDDKRVVVARWDIGEIIAAPWEDVRIERVGRRKFRLSHETSSVMVDTAMYENGRRLLSALARKSVLERNKQV